MGEQIGFRSRLTPDPLLPGDAGVCSGPDSPCTGKAVERIVSLPAGMRRVGTRPVLITLVGVAYRLA